MYVYIIMYKGRVISILLSGQLLVEGVGGAQGKGTGGWQCPWELVGEWVF